MRAWGTRLPERRWPASGIVRRTLGSPDGKARTSGSQPPSEPQHHRRDNDREPARKREAVAAAGGRESSGCTIEVPVEQRSEGAKAEDLVDGYQLEGVGHRGRTAGGNRRDKGLDPRRA